MHLVDAIECFILLAQAERHLSPRTIQLYEKCLVLLEAFARSRGRSRLADLTPNLLRGAAASLMSDDHPATAPNYLGGEVLAGQVIAATRSMVRRLHDEYPDLPLPDLSSVHAPKVPKRIQPRLQDGEYAALEAAIRLRLLRDRVPRFLIARDLAILQVLANTGLRAFECCGLDLDDIDLNEGTLNVHGKGNKWRVLTIRDPDPAERDGGEAIRALVDYLRYRERTFGPGRTEALWLTNKGNRLGPAGLRKVLSVLCDEAGLDGNRPPHAFRRAHFTDHYREDPTALPILVERMGWESEVMARVYTRGARVELARRHPISLLSKQWREASPKVPITPGRPRPIPFSGTDPPRRVQMNGRAGVTREREAPTPAASQARRSGSTPPR